MELIVKGLSGDTKRLTVDCNATVGELKKMISREFINLDDDSRCLRSYGLSSMSTVMLLVMNPVSLPMQVFVSGLHGVVHTYDVDFNETVYELKSKIYNKLGIPVDDQRLLYNGMQLEESKKLKDYNITPGSTIDMLLRFRA